MTVAQLIALLQTLPATARVVLDNPDSEFLQVPYNITSRDAETVVLFVQTI